MQGLDFVSVRIRDFKPTQSILWTEGELNKVVEEFKGFLKKKSSGKVLRIE